MRQADEPTVEDILASIKKVIARDHRESMGREGAGLAPRAFPASGFAGHGEDPENILDLADEDVEELEHAPEAADAGRDVPLTGDLARASMRDSLAALAMLAEPGAQPKIVRSGETSLEGLVRDMLRPMLAQWLDRNLPPLVEAMVASEIRRIVGKQR